MEMKSTIKIAWGFAVLWLLPIACLTYVLRHVGVSDQSVAAIVALYLWSGVLMLVLFPARLPKRLQSVAAGMMAIALVTPLKAPLPTDVPADISG
jgi:hypothetical protein